MQDALLQRLAEREVGYYGKPGLSRPGAITKGAAPGMVSPVSAHAHYPRMPSLVIPACEPGTFAALWRHQTQVLGSQAA